MFIGISHDFLVVVVLHLKEAWTVIDGQIKLTGTKLTQNVFREELLPKETIT